MQIKYCENFARFKIFKSFLTIKLFSIIENLKRIIEFEYTIMYRVEMMRLIDHMFLAGCALLCIYVCIRICIYYILLY